MPPHIVGFPYRVALRAHVEHITDFIPGVIEEKGPIITEEHFVNVILC